MTVGIIPLWSKWLHAFYNYIQIKKNEKLDDWFCKYSVKSGNFKADFENHVTIFFVIII